MSHKMTIANPVYDIVFKYLMEDDRIARTILSALLKMEVVDVKMRPHEYSDDNRDTLSVYRIDFGATIRDNDGKEKLTLIELQKTWLETETLRFRQYLGVHYSNPKNMTDSGHALPMVAVYLLGHKVGDIEEPVLYVNHQSYDHEGHIVTKGIPNSFVDSLNHDSIIVQIPRLHSLLSRPARPGGSNRLDMVLSLFDQTNRDENDSRLLKIDGSLYANDTEMERILHRLTMAAADAEMRHKMNVEDEYFSIIEKRDTEILMRDHQIAEQKAQLTEQKAQLTEQKAQLTEQKAQLTEQKAQLTEQRHLLRMTIKLLLDSGQSIEQVAKRTELSIEDIKQLLS